MIFEKVVNIIAEQLGVDDVESITMETSMMKDLEADSLDAVEIMMALEDEFGVTIPDEDAENFKNIGDIVKYVQEKTE
ncbi:MULTISPECIES: acyl carrier protein [Tissierella]|uniref:Acyl carrier protein n=1 Tax=Tissierella praeacuta DSM 18095 TaxID=1123404 RepID=A0A1M4W4Z0_9FIRM|nr:MULTISPECIES: acyl carrier protein [Tissierella]TCU75622.1 acyl carrier protein [Tissierella praeacuta]SHE76210.1 acyl carrier protein [Tissierella praeacuta DSM 18095]SUP00090.1 Acyl carrier protein [Tissierella praeacuta]